MNKEIKWRKAFKFSATIFKNFDELCYNFYLKREIEDFCNQ